MRTMKEVIKVFSANDTETLGNILNTEAHVEILSSGMCSMHDFTYDGKICNQWIGYLVIAKVMVEDK